LVGYFHFHIQHFEINIPLLIDQNGRSLQELALFGTAKYQWYMSELSSFSRLEVNFIRT
jgi:hypothetical protein